MSENRTCAFADCGRTARALGLCTGHVRQHYLGRGLRPIGYKPLLRSHRVAEGSVLISLTRGKEAAVDLVDSDLALFNWFAMPGGDTWYPARKFQRNIVWLHRVIAERMGLAIVGLDVDHKDGDGLNCRRSNLRPATISQNTHNTRAPRTNTSGFKGVCWSRKANQWMARIMADGQRHYLGYFDSKADAGVAYARAARIFHGEFARAS